MILVTAVLWSLSGPLFWRDYAETCDAAVEQLAVDANLVAPDRPMIILEFNCDDEARTDGPVTRPSQRLTTASGSAPVVRFVWPVNPDED